MDYDQLLNQWQERQEQERQNALDLVIPWLITLKNQGITTIIVTYNGSGDDGCIDSVELEPHNLTKLTDQATKAIEELVFELLPDGWEINEGSEGMIRFDLMTATISREHYWLQPTLDETLVDIKLNLEDNTNV
ncbi:MAG: hypothetical protein SV375_21345 [Thermodesulfobacteriota bacterium]|nr:hypothetical protein [Thermodesulfobacteriota bacterium]